MANRSHESAQPCQRLATAPARLTSADERGVGPDRDVVQEQPLARPADIDPQFLAAEGLERRKRIVAVETDIAREVVTRPEGNADEGQLALECNLRNRRQRPVAAGNPDRGGVRFASNRHDVVLPTQHVRVDPSGARCCSELVGAWTASPRARIDQEEAGQGRARIGPSASQFRPFGSWILGRIGSIIHVMSDRGFHRIEADLEESWLEDWAGVGIAELEAYLAKHAAFLSYLEHAKN